MSNYPYIWTWRNRRPRYPWAPRLRMPWFGDGIDRSGQHCRVVVGFGDTMNSALIEFEDGYRVITSRGGVRRA